MGMNRILPAALIICLFGACEPRIKAVNLEKPSPTPIPTAILDSLPDTSLTSAENVSEVYSARTPTSQLTKDGEFYLLERMSKVTDVRVVGISAGKKVKVIKSEGAMMTVTDGQEVFEVEGAKLTRDIEKGEAIQARVSAEKQATAKALNKYASAESTQVNLSDTTGASHSQNASSDEVSEPRITDLPGLTLSPQPSWSSSTSIGQEMGACENLYRGLGECATANSSLNVDRFTEIFEGVKFMMPLNDALKILRLDGGLIPPKSSISHAGVPFYFRPFSLRGTPRQKVLSKNGDIFNLLYVITDWNDRVVGILLVCESPKNMTYPNSAFRHYNFILTRAKIVEHLKVRFDLEVFKDSDLIVIDTWLIDEKRTRCLEINSWYLPRRIAGFIKHVLENKLGIASTSSLDNQKDP